MENAKWKMQSGKCKVQSEKGLFYMKKCKDCGSDEFITKPNSYEIHKIIDGKLCFQRNELINNDIKLYCRNCGKEYSFGSFENFEN